MEPRPPSILHLDMDAFFAAVEQAHKPSLRGKPVIVGGVGVRGVVSTASYEARAYGARSAMATAVARRLCPNAAFLAPRFHAYHAVSEVVMALLAEVSGVVEPVSLDEAFVDLSIPPGAASPEDGSLDVDVETATEIATELRVRIRERTGLTASVGIGTSKLIAKVASDADKPDGLVVVAPGTEQRWLDPLPVRALWGVGPATADRLRKVGVATVSELRTLSEGELTGLFGQAHGGSLYLLARGLDRRRVSGGRESKSVSVEDTFPVDLVDPSTVARELNLLVDRLAVRLRRSGHTGRTITVKARGADFTTVTRSETFAAPTDDPESIRQAALRLLGPARAAATATAGGGGIRLLGVGVSGLADFAQGDLFSTFDADALDEEPDEADDLHGTDGSHVTAPVAFGPLPAGRTWFPGQDVAHDEHGPGWVQGSGVGKVTVRFETPDSPPGRIRTFRSDDPALVPVDAADVALRALQALQREQQSTTPQDRAAAASG